MFKTRRRIVVGLATVAAVAAFAGSASAATTGDQLVSGTTLSTLSLGAAAPAVLTGFAPGSTATGSGAMVVTSTNPWTLKAQDNTGNAGHLAQTGGSCTGSEATTANALSVTSGGAVPSNTTSSGAVTLSGTAQTVITGVFADTVTNNYSLALGSTESLLTGCIYGTTITYTVS